MHNGIEKNVFVVHGRNWKAKSEMFAFLRKLGLNPIEWEEAEEHTGKTSPFLGEVLDVGFNMAQAVIILLTGDDMAYLKSEYITTDDPEYESIETPQPRPNVLFEAGMAFATHPNRTILVELGKLRPFSDVAGRIIIKIDDTGAKLEKLAKSLERAGCKVQKREDWMETEFWKVM